MLIKSEQDNTYDTWLQSGKNCFVIIQGGTLGDVTYINTVVDGMKEHGTQTIVITCSDLSKYIEGAIIVKS